MYILESRCMHCHPGISAYCFMTTVYSDIQLFWCTDFDIIYKKGSRNIWLSTPKNETLKAKQKSWVPCLHLPSFRCLLLVLDKDLSANESITWVIDRVAERHGTCCTIDDFLTVCDDLNCFIRIANSFSDRKFLIPTLSCSGELSGVFMATASLVCATTIKMMSRSCGASAVEST